MMNDVLKWVGRIIVFGVGVVAIVMGATSHGHDMAMGIIRGIAAVGIAVYATVRGSAGTTQVTDDTQLLGLINPNLWYDWLVVGGLFVVIVITFLV
jgi:hypothetical protein